MAAVSAVILFTVAAALLYAVTALLSKFLAAWPGAPFHFPSYSSAAFHEQLPPDLLRCLFQEAYHTFWIFFLNSAWGFLVATFLILLGVVCCAFIGVFLRFVFRPILDALADANRSPEKTGHVMIPTMDVESAPAKVGLDGN